MVEPILQKRHPHGQETTAPDASGVLLVKSLSSTLDLPTILFSMAAVSALFYGWQARDEYLVSAEHGLGYGLGIAGGSMMLLLLVYPVRKRFQRTALLVLSTQNWFKLHMALGILGPLLILYHCNFSFGSINSNVALSSMILMVSSGLVGRFIYGKIHYGLFGKKAELKELQVRKTSVRAQLDTDQENALINISDGLVDQLLSFERAAAKRRGALQQLATILSLGIATRWGYIALLRRLRRDQRSNPRFLALPRSEKRQHLEPVRAHIAAYFAAIRKIAELSFYERLFSLWHVLHLPIFFMLIITGFMHVYAVHTY